MAVGFINGMQFRSSHRIGHLEVDVKVVFVVVDTYLGEERIAEALLQTRLHGELLVLLTHLGILGESVLVGAHGVVAVVVVGIVVVAIVLEE